MKKKIITVTLAFCLLLSLAGCDKNTGPDTSAAVSPSPSASGGQTDAPTASPSDPVQPSADEYVYGDDVPVEELYRSGTIKNDDGDTLVTYDIALPQISGAGVADTINTYYNGEMTDFLYVVNTELTAVAEINLESAENGGTDYMSCYANQNYDVRYSDDSLLSISRSMDIYYGSVSVDLSQKAETFDMLTGQMITLDQLFIVSQDVYIRRLTEEVAAQIAAQGGVEAGYYENYAERAQQYFYQENYYLTQNGITVFYPTITVAPMVLGLCSFEIPYGDLSDILSDTAPVSA